jgi:spore coat protein A, manganese oxidase
VRFSRREFLRANALLGAAAIIQGAGTMLHADEVRRPLSPRFLKPFVDPLPIPELARPIGRRAVATQPGLTVPLYRIEMREFAARLHRDLKPTRQWGYNGATPGPTFEIKRGQGIVVEWANRLPSKHFLPIDHHIHGAEAGKPEVRAVTHLHGGKTPPDSDGYPENWYVPGKSAFYYYPGRQDAATLWYHDHAMGISRLNILAGLFGLYLIRDDLEAGLHLPHGKYEIPLALYDRTLDQDGQLYYPVSIKPGAPWVPEFRGNMIVANGKIAPFAEVEPCKYRLRILNCSNGRTLILSMSDGQPFYQIGSDQGLMAAPVELRTLHLQPAERADVVVDFAGRAGQPVVMRNQALSVIQFRVGHETSGLTGALPATLRPIARIPEAAATKTRVLTLEETVDYAGASMIMLLNATRWHMPVTEDPVIDSVEIWSLVNLTQDAHPVHLHLVRFQVLDRRPFDEFTYNANRTIKYTGPAMPPDPNEIGWKDTVRAEPGMVTRIIVRFEGYPGRYVWHCHNLEHEDNEMMRPYEVVTSAALSTGSVRPAVGGPLVYCRRI